MKKLIWVFICVLAIHSSYSQLYLRGEIKDERGRLLEGVRINLVSKGSFPFFSGSSGTFGIPVAEAMDSIILSFDGYETFHSKIDTRKFQNLQMKMLPTTAHLYNKKLSSLTTNLKTESANFFSVLGESYSNIAENGFIDANKYPETGFALHIDKASYSNMRRFVNNEMLVPTDAIRIEEMLNYFDFSSLSHHSTGNQFNCITKITSCPWEKDDQLLFVNITAPKLNLDSVPASNLVFLIDISGSMDKPNRLPLLQSAFKLLTENLREIDTITIVTYGGGIGVALQPTPGDNKKKIKDAIDSLTASGDTPGADAIKVAYDYAKRSFIHQGNNRVIMATDGDFNVGKTTEKELEDMISAYKQSGIYLTCLGVGMGNYKDSKLESLAKKGNGNFAYIDNLQEAQKVLVTEFTQTAYAVANNAFLKIEFIPNTIQEYRLIGFDNKINANSDSTSELEGGEVGSGHSMMAIFELKPQKRDSLLYQTNLATLTLQYKLPAKDSTIREKYIVPYSPVKIEDADSAYRFAAAVAAFGSILKQSRFIKKYSLEENLQFAKESVNQDDFHQKEFLSLIEKAIKIYKPVKRKK